MKHHTIDYIEFASTDLTKIKQFYSGIFGWKFTDYGPEYTSFESETVSGGFYIGTVVKGSVLLVIYSENLGESKAKVTAAGGVIVRDIFEFPGGKRFHFTDPDGNELAIWSEK